MKKTNLSKQQQVSEIMRQMLTQAQTAGQYFTNDQIKEMTRTVSAEVDLVHQQTQNQRYGSSHIGATAKDISFFFQAEDGIRDVAVTGVQTCALPILTSEMAAWSSWLMTKTAKMKATSSWRPRRSRPRPSTSWPCTGEA